MQPFIEAFHSIWPWLTGGTTLLLLHRHFLSFANSLPDIDPAASYFRRTAFNFVQGMAGNERRVVTARPTKN